MCKLKICPKCQREYEKEHVYCSICGVSLIPNPSYLSEQDSLKYQETTQAPKKEYSDFQYELAEKEFIEKIELLVSKYRLHGNEYSIQRTISDITVIKQNILTKFINKEDLDDIKNYCEKSLRYYCDMFNEKFKYIYLIDRLFDFDVSVLDNRCKIVINQLRWKQDEYMSFTRSRRSYPLADIADNNLPIIKKDILIIEKLYKDLSNKLMQQSSKDRFIVFINEPNLVNELFNILKITNETILKHDEAVTRIRKTH